MFIRCAEEKVVVKVLRYHFLFYIRLINPASQSSQLVHLLGAHANAINYEYLGYCSL
jgi:hypothetical protein